MKMSLSASLGTALVVVSALVFTFTASSLHGQDFSGTLVYSMRAEVTDPALQKQVADAQAQLANPEVQAQLKAAQEAMNRPEMQAALKANPEMKALLEKQFGVTEKPGAGGVASNAAGGLFPKSFTLQLKGPQSLVRTEGGIAASEILTIPDRQVAYQINRADSTYRKVAISPAADGAVAETYAVTVYPETVQILGYTCKQYLVEGMSTAGKTSYTIWATNGIPGLTGADLTRFRMGTDSPSAYLQKIDGVPLRINAVTPRARIYIEAVSVKAEALPDSLFTVPAGFTELATPAGTQ